MCTLVGHTLVGCSVGLRQSQLFSRNRWIIILWFFILSNLPDIDFLFGFFYGNPNLYHHYWTHSITFALMIGFIFFLGYKVFARNNSIKIGIFVSLIILSHLLLDFFALDYSNPKGVQFLWPFNNDFYSSSFALFLDVSKASSNNVFIGSLFCWHNLYAILIEIAITGPLFMLIWIWRKARK